MDVFARRDLLVTGPNPDSRRDYVVTLGSSIPDLLGADNAKVVLRYVPDKLILVPSSLDEYLKAHGAMSWNNLEEVAVAIRDDVNNEVVPRWLQISVSSAANGDKSVGHHDIMLEDRQPKWDNAALLLRLRRY